MNIFVFDIETIPDVVSGRRLFSLEGLDDHDTVLAMQALQREKNGSDFLPLHLQRIVAISVVLRSAEALKVWSLGSCDSDEKDIIQRFFHGLEKYTPVLVSWNGGGFDLPVLHYRSLLHGVAAPKYWEVGENEANFRWNNYLNRFHYRHTDLMDVLAGYQSRANAPLDDIACMMGFPGKMGMAGNKVWENFQQGNIEGIRNYCETDVLNTYLVYLRFELIRGNLTQSDYQAACEQLQTLLAQAQKDHLQQFLEVWQNSSKSL